jgi:hypothetical protein
MADFMVLLPKCLASLIDAQHSVHNRNSASLGPQPQWKRGCGP